MINNFSFFNFLHTRIHDFPLILKSYIKRFYFKEKWYQIKEAHKYKKKNKCLIWVNGPSFNLDKEYIEKESLHKKNDLICVNYAALSDDFFNLKPNIYAFADPLFWREDLTKKHLLKNQDLFNRLEQITWQVTFLIPQEGYEIIKKRVGLRKNHHFILIPDNRYHFINQSTYLTLLDKNIVTPVFGNVLILAIYFSIMANYQEISIFGADFDVFKSLQTDQDTNEVYSGGLHYYDQKFRSETQKYRNKKPKMMHIRLEQARNAFYQIYILSKFAKKRGVFLFNKSSYSILDSIQRQSINVEKK